MGNAPGDQAPGVEAIIRDRETGSGRQHDVAKRAAARSGRTRCPRTHLAMIAGWYAGSGSRTSGGAGASSTLKPAHRLGKPATASRSKLVDAAAGRVHVGFFFFAAVTGRARARPDNSSTAAPGQAIQPIPSGANVPSTAEASPRARTSTNPRGRRTDAHRADERCSPAGRRTARTRRSGTRSRQVPLDGQSRSRSSGRGSSTPTLPGAARAQARDFLFGVGRVDRPSDDRYPTRRRTPSADQRQHLRVGGPRNLGRIPAHAASS